MVNTVTIYNKFKDPNTGKNSFYRVVLKHVRIMSGKSDVVVGEGGPTRHLMLELWIDPETSKAGTVKAGKAYRKLPVWAAEPDKSDLWTLQEQDYVVDEACDWDLTPANEEDFIEKYGPYKLSSIVPIFDKPGNVHHWECGLV